MSTGLRLATCGLTALLLPTAAWGKGPVVWNLTAIRGPWLYSQSFALPEAATLDVTAVGSADPEDGDAPLLCYAWILDEDAGEVVWQQTPENTERVRRQPGNRRFSGEVELPPGRYTAYYSAIGRQLSEHRIVKLFGRDVFQMITPQGFFYDWDAYGEPSEWVFKIQITDDDYPAVDVTRTRNTPDDALIRFAPLGNDAYETAAFRLTRDVEVELVGIGEWSPIDKTFADYAWLENAWTRETVWRLDEGNSEPAGGARKNRRFDDRIRLPEGEYVLGVVTDDSHAFESWNEAPPYDPNEWGVTLRLVSNSDENSIELIEDPEKRLTISKIDQVSDSAYVRRAFSVKQPLLVRMEGLGEQWHRSHVYADFGWLEQVPSRRIVWSMENQNSRHAGGHERNRLVTGQIMLDPGTYVLSYVSDESHAYNDWSGGAPTNPRNWGIGVYAADRDFDPSAVAEVDATNIDPAILSLAPTGDSSHRRQVMTLRRPYDLRIVCLGEGLDKRMYDYGWIEDADTGDLVWEMKYMQSRPAGGATKNRYVETIISLPAGRYRVHYQTDGSHSFPDWNDTPPEHREMWGITIYRADGPSIFD